MAFLGNTISLLAFAVNDQTKQKFRLKKRREFTGSGIQTGKDRGSISVQCVFVSLQTPECFDGIDKNTMKNDLSFIRLPTHIEH